MKTNASARAHRILETATRMAEKFPGWEVASRIEEIRLHFEGYAEPGYTDPECGIIATGNWNTITKWDNEKHERSLITDLPARISTLFEKMGIEIEWSDEWSECSDCSKLVRTSPDSYGWQCSYRIDDGELLCHECIEKDPEAHLLTLEGNDRECNTISSIDPAKHGYVKVSTGESGLHPGQTDNPRVVAKALRDKGYTRILFNLDDQGQFDVHWSAWVHESDKGAEGESEDEPDSYYEGADKKYGLPHKE